MGLKESAKSILVSSMGVTSGENVLIVTDETKKNIGHAIYEAAKELNCEAMIMLMQDRRVSGTEPPDAVAAAMKVADVVICPTDKSLTHTTAKIEAIKNGARIATMPGITESMFEKGAITADYEKVKKLTNKVTALLDISKNARIEKDGYILNIPIDGRKGVASTGVYKEKGEGGNLPSGEGYIAPIENTANGEIIIDGSMVLMGKLESPLYMKIVDGKLEEVRGENKEKLDILFENDNNRTLGELGIGTNEKAILCGLILEDEKVYGTIHIAFGTNTSFGGTVKANCHVDAIVLKPTLYLDDTLVIKEGIFQNI